MGIFVLEVIMKITKVKKTQPRPLPDIWKIERAPTANQKTYYTTSRSLEQFLYAHRIYHISLGKDSDTGYTVWEFTVDNRLIRTVNEYNEIINELSTK